MALLAGQVPSISPFISLGFVLFFPASHPTSQVSSRPVPPYKEV